MKGGIIRCGTEKMKRSVIVYVLGWSPVYEVGGSKESLIPILQGHRRISQEGESYLNNVPMLAFGDVILLMSMWAGHVMRDANGTKERI
jgi:hypothetical protein